MGRERYKAQTFIDAITGSGGFITAIAKRVGCSRNTAQRYCDLYPSVAQALDDERETMLDAIEAVAFNQARDGDGAMVRYILSTKGKVRGYTERHEVTGAEGGPLPIIMLPPVETADE